METDCVSHVKVGLWNLIADFSALTAAGMFLEARQIFQAALSKGLLCTGLIVSVGCICLVMRLLMFCKRCHEIIDVLYLRCLNLIRNKTM